MFLQGVLSLSYHGASLVINTRYRHCLRVLMVWQQISLIFLHLFCFRSASDVEANGLDHTQPQHFVSGQYIFTSSFQIARNKGRLIKHHLDPLKQVPLRFSKNTILNQLAVCYCVKKLHELHEQADFLSFCSLCEEIGRLPINHRLPQ